MTVTSSKRSVNNPVAALTRRWASARTTGAPRYGPFEVLYESPLTLVFGSARPAQLLFMTGDTLPRRLHDELHRFPVTWMLAWRPGMPGREHAREIAALSRRFALPVRFVGDISPYDVHVFLEYRHRLSSWKVRIQWAGIGGAWLTECARRLGGIAPFRSVLVDLTPEERRHRDQLERCEPRLPGLLGEDVWAILRSGRKLTIEAASGMAAFGRDIHRAIVRSLSRR